MRSLALAATVLSLTWVSAAEAVEFRLKGTRLIIKDTGSTKKLVFLSKDPAVPDGAPVPGGPDDPSVVGAIFTINATNVNGTEIAQLVLPASGWTVQQMPTSARFRFAIHDAPVGSPVRSALLRGGLLKIKAQDSGISLDESSQAAIGVRLDAGSMTWCSSFETSIVQNEPGRFKAKAQSAPPSGCVAQTTTTTSTTLPLLCGNGVIEPGEQCDGEDFCTAACTVEAIGCCQLGTPPDLTCAFDAGGLYPGSGVYLCTSGGGTYVLGSRPAGTTPCPDAEAPIYFESGPCGPVASVSPATLCCEAADCIDAAVDDMQDVSAFVGSCRYELNGALVAGTCGVPPVGGVHPGAHCVPAH